MTAYQIILAAIAGIFLTSNIAKFLDRRHGHTLFKFIASSTIWGGIMTFSIMPTAGHSLSQALGLGENLNTLIFIGFIIVFAIIFRLLSTIEQLERSLSEFVRRDALRQINRD
jgi:hypothetical protein